MKVYFNKEGFFRVKPVYNEQVNGYWMCDEGRDMYKFVNRENRFLKARKRTTNTGWEEMQPGAAAEDTDDGERPRRFGRFGAHRSIYV